MHAQGPRFYSDSRSKCICCKWRRACREIHVPIHKVWLPTQLNTHFQRTSARIPASEPVSVTNNGPLLFRFSFGSLIARRPALLLTTTRGHTTWRSPARIRKRCHLCAASPCPSCAAVAANATVGTCTRLPAITRVETATSGSPIVCHIGGVENTQKIKQQPSGIIGNV